MACAGRSPLLPPASPRYQAPSTLQITLTWGRHISKLTPGNSHYLYKVPLLNRYKLSLTSCQRSLTSCQLSLTRCQLSLTSCQLPLTRCQLSLTRCQMSLTSCQLSLTSCQLLLTKCQLSLTRCQLSLTSCQLSLTSCPSVSQSSWQLLGWTALVTTALTQEGEQSCD